jgi:hypothetical protein
LRADGKVALRLRRRCAQQQQAGCQHQRFEKAHRHTPKGLCSDNVILHADAVKQ